VEDLRRDLREVYAKYIVAAERFINGSINPDEYDVAVKRMEAGTRLVQLHVLEAYVTRKGVK